MSNQTFLLTCRTARAEDASAITALILGQGKSGSYSETWIRHHFSDVFVAIGAEGALEGVLISWKSPSQYNTVVVDQLSWTGGDHAVQIADLLLAQAVKEWQFRCIRHVSVAGAASQAPSEQFWEGHGFDKNSAGEYRKTLLPLRICLHGKKMRPNLNTSGGQIGEQTLFEYQQDGDFVWGTYHGGDVSRGVLVGKMNASRDISFYYMQFDGEGKFHEGTSKSSTEYLNDGRLVLYEDWIWTGGDKKGEGNAIIEEIKE